VEGGGGGLTVSGVSRNRGSFVKCVAIQKRLGIPAVDNKLLETGTACCGAVLSTLASVSGLTGSNLSREID
jgi:hypothetical protein